MTEISQTQVKNQKFGISQGRLTESEQLQRFPSEDWQAEFYNAQKVGINFIELLTEREFNKDNPVWSISGRQEIKDVCAATKCEIYSICIDYIINHSLLDDRTALENVRRVFAVASDLGCKVVIFPLLEESNLIPCNSKRFAEMFILLAAEAANHNLMICVETLMKASDLVEFLERVNRDNVKAVFDTGNRVVVPDGSDLHNEILCLDAFIAHVHIKDKNGSGENVILGTGLVDFRTVFSALRRINYRGPLNFETTRGRDPLATAAFHVSLCKFFQGEVNKDL
jgi:sugar phosphate isomerase/epimerase